MTKKALTLSEFADLPGELQFDLLHKHGVYVGKRKCDNYAVVLFQLHGFYVEVFYKKYRKDIDHVITSATTDILHPYLNQINVNELNEEEGSQ